MLLGLLLFHTKGWAQNSLVYQWDHSFGGGSTEYTNALIATADGGFLVGGTTRSQAEFEVTQANFDPTGSTDDVWLIKCDPDGAIQWDARFGGTLGEDFGDIIQTTDGGYAFCMATNSPISGNLTGPEYGARDVVVMKLDANGAIIWQQRFGGSANESVRSIVQTPDGGFLVGGSTLSSSSGTITATNHGASDYYMIKLNSAGAMEWDRVIGAPGDEGITSIIPTTGGYWLAGASWSGIGGDKTLPNYVADDGDFWIVKTDTQGAILYDRVIGTYETDRLAGAIGYPDGGLILGSAVWADIGGDKSENTWGAIDGWIIRLDANADILWDHSVGGDSHEDDFGHLSLTSSGNILASGTSYSNPSGWKGETNVGPENTWVVEIDPTGAEVWDKTVLTGYAHSETAHAVQLLDGCYVFADDGDALVGNDKSEISYGFDYWVVKYCPDEQAPAAGFSTTVNAGCSSALVNFTNSSTNTTLWTWTIEGVTLPNPNAQFLNNVLFPAEGTYLVTLVACNANACDTTTQTVSIVFSDSLTVELGDTLTLCPEDDVLLNAGDPGAAYAWTQNGVPLANSTANLVVTIPGTYGVIVTDSGGCVGTDSVVVIPVVEAISIGADISLCTGSTALITADILDGGFQWFHDGVPVGGNSPSLAVFEAGVYWVHHTYACGSNSDTLQVVEVSPLTALVLPDSATVCPDEPLLLILHSAAAVTWSTGTVSDTLIVTNAGTYTATVANACGAERATVTVAWCAEYAPPTACPVVFPNVFTPNRDGTNDLFIPIYDALCVSILDLSIYNRWGQMVHNESTGHPAWNGNVDGAFGWGDGRAPDGVYYYVCELQHAGSGVEVATGHVTLLR